jgi:nucleotide-binding universal stress UspA family protein
MYEKILIATDGSPTASVAARVGAGLAAASGAEAILLYVGSEADGAAILQQARQDLGESIRIETAEGDPADKIIEAAESQDVDLIVVGNRGMTGAKRFLLGNVPNKVSHHAPCNVLIVKTT